MKLIPLTQGKFAQVDDEDYDFLMQWKWYAKASKDTDIFYAARTDRSGKSVKTIRMHRVILKIKSKKIIDHINHNGLDNQKHNLRICTPSQNSRNRRSSKNSYSKFLGVSMQENTYKGKTNKLWFAQLCNNRKRTFLGYFPFTPEGEVAAAKAYDETAKKYYGEFANLNFKE